jgi:hypothetical protein
MHKNRRLLLITVLTILLISLACQLSVNNPIRIIRGSGNVETEERAIGGFSRIDLSGVGDVEVEFGNAPALRVEAEDNLLPLIVTEVVGSTLRIRFKENTNPSPTEPIRYFLTAVSIDGIDASGLGSVQTPPIEAADFSVNISGAGDVNLASLDAGSLDVDLSGLGSLKVDGGSVARLNVNISGGGGVDTEGMEAQEAFADISGLGGATIRVQEHLQVDISGTGSVKYYGSPTVEENVSGLGNVEKVGD